MSKSLRGGGGGGGGVSSSSSSYTPAIGFSPTKTTTTTETTTISRTTTIDDENNSSILQQQQRDIITTMNGDDIIRYLESHPELENLRVEQVFALDGGGGNDNNDNNNNDNNEVDNYYDSDNSDDENDVEAYNNNNKNKNNINPTERYLKLLDDILSRRYAKNIHLKSIELPHNQINGSLGHCNILSNIILHQSETLIKLDISFNPISSQGIQDLLTKSYLTNLIVLNLNSCKLGNTKSATTITNFLRRSSPNQTIQELYLSNNDLGTKGMSIIAPAISSHPTLEKLDVSYNKLKSKGGSTLAKAIMNTTSSSSSKLRVLDVTCNRIGSNGMQSFATWLSNDKVLEELYIGSNIIGLDGAAHIASILRVNYKLRILNISDNLIGNDGLNLIAQHGTLTENDMRGNASIERLDVSWNSISDDGIVDVLANNTLMENSILQNLNLTGNQISDIGVTALMKSLDYNLTLRELDLTKNKIGNEGAYAITIALSKPTCNITSLSWDDNPNIGQEGFQSLSRITQIRNNQQYWLYDMLKSLSKGTITSVNLINRTPYIGNEELILLCDVLVNDHPLIRSLWLSGGGGGGRSGRSGKSHHHQCMGGEDATTNPPPTMITLRGILPIIDQGLSSPLSNIERIYLKDFKSMGDDIAKSFRDALCQNTTLEVLSITDSSMTGIGATDIAYGLQNNTTLRRLQLDRNQIGDKGMESLANAVLLLSSNNNNSGSSNNNNGGGHPSLVSLAVCNNNISDKVMTKVGQSLKVLHELHLNWNLDITISGALDLCKFLQSSDNNSGDGDVCKLTYLSLRGTTISRIGIETIQNFLPNNAVVDY